MTYYLVMDAWNCLVCKETDEAKAKSLARSKGGYVVYIKRRGF